jgi:hypothetical protein
MSNFKSEFSKDLVKKFFKPKTEETQNGTCVPDQGATPFNGADDCIAGQQMLQPKPNNDTNIKREGAYKFDELPSLTEVTKAVTDEAVKNYNFQNATHAE